MMLDIERKPRLVTATEPPESRFVVVICTGLRRNGKHCNRALGEINIHFPHDVQYTCRDCGSTYVLQKPIN